MVYWPLYSSHTSHHPSQILCLPWISNTTQKLMLDLWSKSSLKHSIHFCGIFPGLKQNFIAYHSFEVSSHPDCIFEIHQLWQSGFSRVYSNSCCSCSFEPEIIKISQSSHKMYSNKILIFQESTTILMPIWKKVCKLIECTMYIYIYIYIYIYM